LGYIQHDPKENSVGRMCKFKERCSDAERHNIFADITDKTSLIFYCDMKFVWVREAYTDCCTRHVRSGLVWFKTGTWKLKIIYYEVGYRRVIKCTNVVELRNIGEYLNKVRCK
jgi:hypothetical protein